jgi:hypothetical protein
MTLMIFEALRRLVDASLAWIEYVLFLFGRWVDVCLLVVVREWDVLEDCSRVMRWLSLMTTLAITLGPICVLTKTPLAQHSRARRISTNAASHPIIPAFALPVTVEEGPSFMVDSCAYVEE